MVDFNNDTTVTRPRQDVVNFIILQRRQDALDKYIEFKASAIKQGSENTNKLAMFQAHLSGLFREIESMLSDSWSKIKNTPYINIEELEKDIESETTDGVMRAWRFIDRYLYSKGLTKTDTREVVDRKQVWQRNQDFLG